MLDHYVPEINYNLSHGELIERIEELSIDNDALQARITALESAMAAIYEIVTRGLAKPVGSETALLVEIATEIEEVTGKVKNE